jgi:hypothetical protein
MRKRSTAPVSKPKKLGITKLSEQSVDVDLISRTSGEAGSRHATTFQPSS